MCMRMDGLIYIYIYIYIYKHKTEHLIYGMRALCLFSLDFFWGKAKENQNIYIKKYMKYITTAALTASETAFFLFFLKNKRKSEYYIRTNMESELFFIVDSVLGKGKVYEIHHNGYSYSYKYFFFF